MWPTNASKYSVRESPWLNGTGDVLAMFVASARKYSVGVTKVVRGRRAGSHGEEGKGVTPLGILGSLAFSRYMCGVHQGIHVSDT